MKMSKYLAPDMRPSKAHPEHRSQRKRLEKEHPAFGWLPGVILGLIGITLAFDIEKEAKKCEERHERAEKDNKERGVDRDRERQRRNQRRDAGDKDGGYGRRDRSRSSSEGSGDRRGSRYDRDGGRDAYYNGDRDRYHRRGSLDSPGSDDYSHYDEPPRRSRSRY